jgi:hypothetical protein
VSVTCLRVPAMVVSLVAYPSLYKMKDGTARVVSQFDFGGSRSGSCAPMFVLVKPKLAFVALQIAALAAVFVWIGGPGPYFAVLLAMVAWRYFLWGDRD